jgi:hypothetical protein
MNLQEILNSYGEVRVKGHRVKVCIPSICRNDRIVVLQKIHENLLHHGAVLKHDRPDYSSIGYVEYQKYKISVKSKKQQDKSSPGVSNEQFLVQKINKYLEEHKNINLIFFSSNFSLFYGDVTVCYATENRKTRKSRNKADMIIRTQNCNRSFSIKQVDAERWESADTSCGKIALQKLEDALSSGKTSLIHVCDSNGNRMYRNTQPPSPIMRVENEIFWAADSNEQQKIIFGDDVVDGGAVLINTFDDSHFEFNESEKTLNVCCDRLYTPQTPIRSQDVPYWIVRNDVTRNCRKLGIMGIRIESVFCSRIKYGVEV